MYLEIQRTEDGSPTLYWPEKNEHYHSTHGAIQEAMTVYIQAALRPAFQAYRENRLPEIRVFEMGFGTGLNTFLSLIEAEKAGIPVQYTSLEAYPLPPEIWEQLDYARILKGIPGHDLDLAACFARLHQQDFDGESHRLSPFFSLSKRQGLIQETELPEACFHVIYYDAFAPTVQPELWQPPIFQKLHRAAATPCILSTYCAQGQFKRNLRDAGFRVVNLPGPAGKREITTGLIEPES